MKLIITLSAHEQSRRFVAGEKAKRSLASRSNAAGPPSSWTADFDLFAVEQEQQHHASRELSLRTANQNDLFERVFRRQQHNALALDTQHHQQQQQNSINNIARHTPAWLADFDQFHAHQLAQGPDLALLTAAFENARLTAHQGTDRQELDAIWQSHAGSVTEMEKSAETSSNEAGPISADDLEREFVATWDALESAAPQQDALTVDPSDSSIPLNEQWAEDFINGDTFATHPTALRYEFERDNPYMAHEDPLNEGYALLHSATSSLTEAALAFEAALQKVDILGLSDAQASAAWEALGRAQQENEKEIPALAALQQAVTTDPTNLSATMVLCI